METGMTPDANGSDPLAEVSQVQVWESGIPIQRDEPSRESEPIIESEESEVDSSIPNAEAPETGAAAGAGPDESDEDAALRAEFIAFKEQKARERAAAELKNTQVQPTPPEPEKPQEAPADAATIPTMDFAPIPEEEFSAAYIDLNPEAIQKIRQRDAQQTKAYVDSQVEGFANRLMQATSDNALGMALAVDVIKQVPEIGTNVWMAAQAIQEAFLANPDKDLMTIQKAAIGILRKEMAVAAKVETAAKNIAPQTPTRTNASSARTQSQQTQAAGPSNTVGRSHEEGLLGLR